MSICYYITSHGFGHATRSFAIIREFLKKGIHVTIRANLPDWLVENSFRDENLKYFSNLETLRVHHDSTSLSLEFNQTIQALNEYFSHYDRIIKNDVKFCKKNAFDLIISDIEPTAFEIAEKAGIDAIAITNFTWKDIIDAILPQNSEILQKFELAYNKALLLFRLPFHFEMPFFKDIVDVPLVYRKQTRSIDQIRSSLNVNQAENLVFMQFGGHISTHFKNLSNLLQDYRIQHPETIFLINRFSELPDLSLDTSVIKVIPTTDTETQDYIAASDLVIGKTGYSLVS